MKINFEDDLNNNGYAVIDIENINIINELRSTLIDKLNISKKIRLIPPAYTPWIQEKDRKLYKKTKLVSMIASNKSMCDFHILRNNLAKKYENSLDLFGRGRKEIVNKVDGLKDYMFSITIENANYDGMISEKLTDCFATGTVPVYLGSEKTVKKIFDAKGVIFLNENYLLTIPLVIYSVIRYLIRSENKDFLDSPVEPEVLTIRKSSPFSHFCIKLPILISKSSPSLDSFFANANKSSAYS